MKTRLSDAAWAHRKTSWADLGRAIVHPADFGGNNRWDWMKCTWDPRSP